MRFGRGTQKLVVFPPLNDALFDVTAFPLYVRLLFSGFSRDFDVYSISRRRPLAVGCSTRDMARDYAEVIRKEIGPAHILGVSLGGMIAQYFAFDYPHLVQKLIVVSAAHRMGPEGLEIARRWIPWAKEGKWAEIYDETLEITYTGSRLWLYRRLKSYLKKYFLPRIRNPYDFITSGYAGIIHDAFKILPGIKSPALVIGGKNDRFFPEALFPEMISEMPSAELFLLEAAHGAFEEHRRECVRRCIAFLRDDNRAEVPLKASIRDAESLPSRLRSGTLQPRP